MYDLIIVFKKLHILLYILLYISYISLYIIYIDDCSNSITNILYLYIIHILCYKNSFQVDFILGDFLETLEGVFFTRVSFFFVGVGVGANDPLVIFRDVLIL